MHYRTAPKTTPFWQMLVLTYLTFGGLFSAVFFIGVLTKTPLISFLLSPRAFADLGFTLHVVTSIVSHSIMRVFVWLPDMFTYVLFKHFTFQDWALGIRIFEVLK